MDLALMLFLLRTLSHLENGSVKHSYVDVEFYITVGTHFSPSRLTVAGFLPCAQGQTQSFVSV